MTPAESQEHARLSMRLLATIVRTQMSPAQRLEALRYMAQKFPGMGWEDAVKETEGLIG